MQLLVQNYPKIIYDMGNLQVEPISKIKQKQQAVYLQNDQTSILKGSDAKMSITTAISSSNYPKLIYGMPLVEKLIKFRTEFEIQTQIEFKSEKKKNT